MTNTANTLNTEAKQPKVIVSLTTIPQKFDYLKKNIASILSQTAIDVMLDQLQWGKYLSNACLFCPLAFGPPESDTFKELYNFEQYNYVVKAKHDELWFWIISTLNGTQCVGLADTFSFELDEINFAKTEYDLSNINGQVEEIRGYNERINEVYGKALIEAIQKKPVVFVLNPMTVQLAVHELQRIRQIYANQNVIFFGKHVAKSWLTYLGHHLKRIGWDVPVIY